jgi:aryl-alcohol dehydrogenase-like predicted oxidoreductase
MQINTICIAAVLITQYSNTLLTQLQQVASNQVQLNLIDRRALSNMTALCEEQNIELLAHGTLLGGLLTDYWLRRRDPGLDALATAAEKKYYPEVLAWGGGRLTHWKQHQALLAHCREVADKHSVSVSDVTAMVSMHWYYVWHCVTTS